MIVECSGCHKRYSLDEAKIPASGGRFKCRNCDAVIEVVPPSAAVKPGLDQIENSRERKKRIVVADDTAFFRAMLEDLLSEAGYEVITAEDGEDALLKIKHELPDLDLVVLDMLMPKMDGFQVIEELKKGAMGQELPVLALTGVFKSDEDRELMKSLGVAGYVDKSIPPEMIVDRVKMTLGDIAPE